MPPTSYAREVMLSLYETEGTREADVLKSFVVIDDIIQGGAAARLLMEAQNSNGRRTRVVDIEHKWQQKRLNNPMTAITVGAASSATSFSVTLAEVGPINNGDTLFNTTREEYAQVIAAVSGTGAGAVTLMLTEGEAGESWAADDEIVSLGHTNTENGTDPTGSVGAGEFLSNYCEETKTPIEISLWALQAALNNGMTGKEYLASVRKMKLAEHGLTLNRKVYLGRKDSGTRGGEKWYTMGGLIDPSVGVISDHDFDLNGATLDKNTLLYVILPSVFKYGSPKKTLFASTVMQTALSAIVDKGSVFNIDANTKVYGQSVQTIKMGAYTLDIVPDAMLDADRLGTKYGNCGVILDRKFAEMVDYGDLGGVKLLKNRQMPNADKYSEVYSSFVGLRLAVREPHAVIRNFVAQSID
jgi:hypothetical protein